jgi:uncharacterized protein (TIGR02391 family)
MATWLSAFEVIVRQAHRFTEAPLEAGDTVHPFESRNIHPDFPAQVRALFDNGHYPQATFEALKYLDEQVQRVSSSGEYGFKMMMAVFGGTPPQLALNPGMTASEKDEQVGYKFLFAGCTMGIRNPRGHSTAIEDGLDVCLDHLSFASMLLRKLDDAGLRVGGP